MNDYKKDQLDVYKQAMEYLIRELNVDKFSTYTDVHAALINAAGLIVAAGINARTI